MLASLGLISALNLVAAPSASNTTPCVLRPTYGTQLLLGDVEDQTIDITGNGSCASLPRTPLLLVNGEDSANRLYVNFEPVKPVGPIARGGRGKKAAPVPERYIMRVGSPAGDAPSGGAAPSVGWNLFANDSVATSGGQASAQMIIRATSVEVTATTAAIYEDSLLTTLAASHAKPPNVAYVFSGAEGTSGEATHFNTATLSFPDVGAVAEWIYEETPNDNVKRVGVGGEALGPRRGAHFHRTFSYIAGNASQGGLDVTLKAKRPSASESFTLLVRLAESAQESSLPLDIAKIAYVSCQKDVRRSVNVIVGDDELAALSNSMLANNRCDVVISEERISWVLAQRHGLRAERVACDDVDVDEDWRRREVEARCQKALRGEEGVITLMASAEDERRLEALKGLYGRQRGTVFVYTDDEGREASRRTFYFSADLKGAMSVPLNFAGAPLDTEKPFHVEVSVQPESSTEPLSEQAHYLDRTYNARLRPKGAFGITHFKNSLGARSVRVFATVPVNFSSLRFPASGLDLESSEDTSAVQITSFTTGLLLTVEPWDYTRSMSMYALPIRFQAGMLMSNWHKGVFHPSTYLGGAITFPLLHGTNQLDTDLALGIGWEVDLRNGYKEFGPRNHLLVTLGVNIFSLFGPKSAPR